MAMRYCFDIVKDITPLPYKTYKPLMVLLVVQPGIESRIFLETIQIWFDMKFGYLLYTSYAAFTFITIYSTYTAMATSLLPTVASE